MTKCRRRGSGNQGSAWESSSLQREQIGGGIHYEMSQPTSKISYSPDERNYTQPSSMNLGAAFVFSNTCYGHPEHVFSLESEELVVLNFPGGFLARKGPPSDEIGVCYFWLFISAGGMELTSHRRRISRR